MEALMSNWRNPVKEMPEKYIFPPEKRPGNHVFPVMDNIPLIDLQHLNSHNRPHIIQQIFHASQEFGIFEVMNHGIPASLMEETMKAMQGFFATSAEHKGSFYSTDMRKKCRIYSSTMNYEWEEQHYWRDNLTHHCDGHLELWPQNPPNYREVVGAYASETRRVLVRILEAMAEGLGLEGRFFEGEMSKTQLLSVNHHIPCPDPTLTLGMPQHTDPNLISMLQQGSVPGLQLLRHNQWMNVQPTPHAFHVIPGLQLKVISNGTFSSPIHRVMAHRGEPRTTIGTFLIPSNEIVISPPADRPLYRPFTYGDFFKCFTGSNCDADTALAFFKNDTVSLLN